MDSLVGDRPAIPDNASTADALIAALLAGGDSRIALDAADGRNKYLCPPRPDAALACFASCTASPITADGLAAARVVFERIAGAMGGRARVARLAAQRAEIAARLLDHFAATGLAEAILCPSGTDALLRATLLLAAERPGDAITAILPNAAETGSGVPLAIAGRRFDGPSAGGAVANVSIATVEIALRDTAGAPRGQAALAADYASCIAGAARRRPIVVLTHATKTGLIAPADPPGGADVIVDACQARIAPETVVSYLGRGWPVVVTGSKFYGGPAFSGAVLFPSARRRGIRAPRLGFGPLLRWSAALAEMDAFAPRVEAMALLLQRAEASVRHGFAGLPDIEPVEGAQPRGTGWADRPSIFTFAVRDALEPARLLSSSELRPLYRWLARRGVLLGQPVDLGAFGGLRLAIGARDLDEARPEARWQRLFAALAEALTPPRPRW